MTLHMVKYLQKPTLVVLKFVNCPEPTIVVWMQSEEHYKVHLEA